MILYRSVLACVIKSSNLIPCNLEQIFLFTALVSIFDRVGLITNVGKAVILVCHPCQAGAGNRTEAGYSRRLMEVGKTYTEQQRERVACGESGTVIADGSMSIHMMT